MQCYTSYIFLWNALHVSGGSSAHHQELKNCIYSIRYFVKPLLLPATVMKEMKRWVPYLPRQRQVAVKVWQRIQCCIYSFWAPDDGRRNRLKHVEQFTEINNLSNVASCWLHLKIHLPCTDPWTSKIFSHLSENLESHPISHKKDATTSSATIPTSLPVMLVSITLQKALPGILFK